MAEVFHQECGTVHRIYPGETFECLATGESFEIDEGQDLVSVTVLCRMGEEGEYEYEEIDIIVKRHTSVETIMRAANDIVQQDYDPRLKPISIIEPQVKVFMIK